MLFMAGYEIELNDYILSVMFLLRLETFKHEAASCGRSDYFNKKDFKKI